MAVTRPRSWARPRRSRARVSERRRASWGRSQSRRAKAPSRRYAAVTAHCTAATALSINALVQDASSADRGAPPSVSSPCADCRRGDAMGRGRRRHATATAGYRLSRVERGPAYRAESGSSMRPLPASLLDALRDEEEVLVTSRDARTGRQGTVPMWFAVGPPGVVYLFTLAYSRKAERWRRDPRVRLTTPGKGQSAEGGGHGLGAAEIDAVAPLAAERRDM